MQLYHDKEMRVVHFSSCCVCSLNISNMSMFGLIQDETYRLTSWCQLWCSSLQLYIPVVNTSCRNSWKHIPGTYSITSWILVTCNPCLKYHCNKEAAIKKFAREFLRVTGDEDFLEDRSLERVPAYANWWGKARLAMQKNRSHFLRVLFCCKSSSHFIGVIKSTSTNQNIDTVGNGLKT